MQASMQDARVVLRARPQEAMRTSARGHSAGRAAGRVRAALVVVEISLAFVLLVGAGLLGRSYARLWSVERGFATEGLVGMWVVPDRATYPSREARGQFLTSLQDRLESIPGISGSAVNNLPLSGMSAGTSIYLERSSSLSASGRSKGRRFVSA